MPNIRQSKSRFSARKNTQNNFKEKYKQLQVIQKAEPNPDGSLSLAQIESDVNFLFDMLRQNYGLYEYFGGEEVFEPARSRVLEQCRENKQMECLPSWETFAGTGAILY